MPRHFLRRQPASIQSRDQDATNPQQIPDATTGTTSAEGQINRERGGVGARAAHIYANFMSSQFQTPPSQPPAPATTITRQQQDDQEATLPPQLPTPSSSSSSAVPAQAQAHASLFSPQLALYSLFGMGVADRRPRAEVMDQDEDDPAAAVGPDSDDNVGAHFRVGLEDDEVYRAYENGMIGVGEEEEDGEEVEMGEQYAGGDESMDDDDRGGLFFFFFFFF